MGSPCRVVVAGGPADLACRLRDLVHGLEARWSRFVPKSEVNALNRASGTVTVVSEPTYQLISRAVDGQQLTEGWFNPLMLDQLERHGYDRPWDDDRPMAGAESTDCELIKPGSCEPIALYPEASAVRLPPETKFDPGGIGKGLAIDRTIEAAIALGATTVSVELGGDLRVHGQPWYGPNWRIRVANPFDPDAEVAAFTPSEGAVTTSTTLRRCWRNGARSMHHLLDPQTGEPTATDIVSVTTCSGVAWWAEVAAKAALLSGSSRAMTMLEDLSTPGLAVTASGTILQSAAPLSAQAATLLTTNPSTATAGASE